MPLVAVDVGNSRVKLGLFDSRRCAAAARAGQHAGYRSGPGEHSTRSASGCRRSTWRARPGGSAACSAKWPAAWWHGYRAQDVGANHDDRLVGLAAERFGAAARQRGYRSAAGRRGGQSLACEREPAIVVDLGTAITVDVIDADGAFLGGAIMPGIATSARAMHEFTDLLPLVEMWKLGQPPAPLGTATVAAMQAGLYWGSRRRSAGTGRASERRFASQAAAVSQRWRGALGGKRCSADNAEYVPHLTLAGIALTAAQ